MASGARYDQHAAFYRESNPDFVRDAVSLALVDMVGPVEGARVLDLACGGGRVTRELARRGARVTGLDVSAALLEYAGAAEVAEPLGITYAHGDCASPDVLSGQQFDAVVCHFGLSDVDDLDGCLATVARVVRSNGTFTFAILHPCFPGWAGDRSASWRPGGGYYEEGYWVANGGLSVLRQRVGANHRMLSTYLNGLVRHGLAPEQVAEPGMPAGWTDEHPDADPVPMYLVARCRRDRGPARAPVA
jgi:SAM-dependent methyltransferase